jgi:hypothetical protein
VVVCREDCGDFLKLKIQVDAEPESGFGGLELSAIAQMASDAEGNLSRRRTAIISSVKLDRAHSDDMSFHLASVTCWLAFDFAS